MNKIKISIITVVYNGEKYIEQCIQSVIQQTYNNIEYIIIDGNSNDSTQSIINKYKNHVTYFISEPDKNMYEAINKGIKISTGDYIGILNSDDFYYSKFVIQKIVNILERNQYASIYGNRLDVNSDGLFIKKKKSFQTTFKQLLFSRHLTFIAHPTFFISKELINKIGYYNTNYNYASDLDYILRCVNISQSVYLNIDMVCFRLHSNSITSSGKINLEREKILHKFGINKKRRIAQKFLYYIIWFKYLVANWKNIPLYIKKLR